VLRLVVGQAARMAAIGLGLGLLAAFGVSRAMASMLYGVSASDPMTYAGVAAVLGAIAVVASWLPARRATRVDPIVALRAE
jgi:ABC-type antimicrobial peptide transport system permease subunit